MNNTLHTPAPWVIHTCNENGPFLDSFFLSTPADDNECERIICRFPTGTGQFFDMGRENLANAHLISAAPDLLSALETCASELNQLAFIQKDKMAGVAIQKAFDAIAKAKGGK
jgi:hypothetical protein